MKIPEHITDLKRKDFEEIAAATNPTPGTGIEIDKKAETITIALNLSQFKRMLSTFNQNGGFTVSPDDLDSIPLDQLIS